MSEYRYERANHICGSSATAIIVYAICNYTDKDGLWSRDLPMMQGVYECFQRILKARRRLKVEPMIDKKLDFFLV